jgi:predicted alpha/beta-fold hydrolase
MSEPLIYSPAWWIPGGHLQTLWGKLFRRQQPAATTSEKWETPDGDFLEVHRLQTDPGVPRVLLLHGLEGTVRSHYAQGLLNEAARRGWGADLLIFRSCGSEPNRTRRFYHSGETGDAAFALDRIVSEFPTSPLAIAGVSLGGNVLLKMLGEKGAICRNSWLLQQRYRFFDLERSSQRINRGFSKFYQHFFLGSLRTKAQEKATRFPDRHPRQRSPHSARWKTSTTPSRACCTARDAQDYYRRSSSLPRLEHIRLNTLLLSAGDDPMLPPEVLDEVREVARRNSALHLEFVPKGGHAGFITGRWPWRPFYYAEYRVGEFFAAGFTQRFGRVTSVKQEAG